MRRYYKKPYQNSKALAGGPGRRKKALQLPEWDSTQHDLSALRLTQEQLERRHQERTSKHHMSLAAQAARQANQRIVNEDVGEPGTSAPAQPHQEQGPTDGRRHDGDSSSSSDSDSADEEEQGAAQQRYQQRYKEELAAFRHELGASSDSEDVVLLDIGNQQQQQEKQKQQPKGQQQQQGQQHQGRQGHSGRQEQPSRDKGQPHHAAVVVTRAHNASTRGQGNSSAPAVPAGSHAEAAPGASQGFQQQVQELQQHLAEERTAHEQLRAEFHEYMAHAGSIITQLQAQMQQLMSCGTAAAGAWPGQQQQQQMQQQAAASRATHGSTSPTKRPGSGAFAGANGDANQGGGHSGAHYSALYPAPWQPSAAAAAAHGAHYSASAAAAAATAASLQQRLARLADEGGVAPSLGVTEEQAVLPSYAEMRRGNAATTAKGAFTGLPTSSPSSSPQRHAHQPRSQHPLHSSSASITDLFSRPVPGPSDRPPYSRPGTAPAHDPTATLLSISASPTHNRWSNAAQAPFVVSSSAADAADRSADGRPSQTLAAKWSNNGMPGLSDVDRHLGQGLPRAAVARLHAQAHHFAPVPLSHKYMHPAEASRTLSLNAHVAAARGGREGAQAGMR